MKLEDLLARAQLTVESAAALFRRLAESPWVRSVDLTVVFPAGTQSVTVAHGLGRAFNGAAVVSMSEPLPCAVVPDSDETSITVRLGGTAPLSPVTTKLRVY